jgi:uncharacterized protein YjbI with pentapeptide repeats
MSVTSFDQLIARYAEGHRNFQNSELDSESGDLRGLDLSDADFSGSFIVADFRSSILRNAHFRHANVKTCDFRGADLRNADFRDAALEATEFQNALLEGAQFAGAGNHGRILRDNEQPDW